jgi:phage FluMu protein Com
MTRTPTGQFRRAVLGVSSRGKPTKRCSRCGRWKELNHFYVRTRDATGNAATWSSRCRYCGKVAQRAYGGYKARKPAMTPDQQRERRHALYAARKAEIYAVDEIGEFIYPERVAAHREAMRVKEKLRRERQGAKPYPPKRTVAGHEIAHSYRPPSGRYDGVDAGPFVAWLTYTFAGWEPFEIAHVLGIPDRRIRELFSGAPRVTLDLVDRALTQGLGRPDLLNDLYPVAG